MKLAATRRLFFLSGMSVCVAQGLDLGRGSSAFGVPVSSECQAHRLPCARMLLMTPTAVLNCIPRSAFKSSRNRFFVIFYPGSRRLASLLPVETFRVRHYTNDLPEAGPRLTCRRMFPL